MSKAERLSTVRHNRSKNIELMLQYLRKKTPSGGATLDELAKLCKVSTRNIYRYINDIEELGFELVRPVQQKPGTPGKGRYRLRRKTLPQSETITDLMMLISYNTKMQMLYREFLNILYEIFVRHLAAKYRLSLPADWRFDSFSLGSGSKSNTERYSYNIKNKTISYYM
ncbi:HTH domain-containing protein [Desulfofalx alkaliphila]|uniref:HTH domain-containing protein n=1 Tax=Desulfofalx alkaliphila TaxID=105483 RepID=UPI0004E1C685|nr:HTH domain-containing protein [Desulfofalx alkaliphila]